VPARPKPVSSLNQTENSRLSKCERTTTWANQQKLTGTKKTGCCANIEFKNNCNRVLLHVHTMQLSAQSVASCKHSILSPSIKRVDWKRFGCIICCIWRHRYTERNKRPSYCKQIALQYKLQDGGAATINYNINVHTSGHGRRPKDVLPPLRVAYCTVCS